MGQQKRVLQQNEEGFGILNILNVCRFIASIAVLIGCAWFLLDSLLFDLHSETMTEKSQIAFKSKEIGVIKSVLQRTTREATIFDITTDKKTIGIKQYQGSIDSLKIGNRVREAKYGLKWVGVAKYVSEHAGRLFPNSQKKYVQLYYEIFDGNEVTKFEPYYVLNKIVQEDDLSPFGW